jgi:hypothetical protein
LLPAILILIYEFMMPYRKSKWEGRDIFNWYSHGVHGLHRDILNLCVLRELLVKNLNI